MGLSYMIVEVLRKHSSETNTLNQKQILKFLQDDYDHLKEEITPKKVRSSLEKMMMQEATLSEEDRVLCYTDAERKRRYCTNNSISDAELKFLIDSVMYGNIINTKNARSLAKRLQGLSEARNILQTCGMNISMAYPNGVLPEKYLRRRKQFAEVITVHKTDGSVSPQKNILSDGRQYECGNALLNSV